MKFNNRTILLGSFLTLFLCAEATAQNWSKLETQRVASDNSVIWTQIAPGNAGFANLLRYHPTTPQFIMNCPDMWNAYQSEDNGKSWYGITDFDGKGDFMHLRELVYSPQPENAHIGVAIGATQLWTTKNKGRNWERVLFCPWYKANPDGTERESWIKKVAALAIDPNDAKTWYVAGGSNSRGQEWLSCYKGVNLAGCRGKDANNMGKMWKTTNAGKSWSEVNNGLHEKAQVGRIIVNPKNSDHVFASSNYGVYESKNGGKSWKQISDGKLDNDIIMDMDFYYDAKSDKFSLYVIDQVQYRPSGKTTICSGGVFKSEDEGKSWRKINGNLALDFNRISGGVQKNYFLYLSKWLQKPIAQVRKLYPEIPKDGVQPLWMLAVDPSREDALYVGFADPQVGLSIMPGRLWGTENDGEKWTSLARLYEDAWAADKEYWEERGQPWHSNMKVGHESPHMRFGKDHGLRSMRNVAVGVDGSIMMISDHSTMLSTDRGASWQQMDETYTPSGAIIGHGNSNLPGLVIEQDQRGEQTLLASGEHRLWKIADDAPEGKIALRFIQEAQESISAMAFDPYNPQVAYATSSRQAEKQYIYRTENGGESWARHGVATPATNKWLDDFFTNGLTIDPINPEYMYLGITLIQNKEKAEMAGFYRSTDGGKQFEQITEGLPEVARINDIQFDPRDKSMKSLFAAAQLSDWEPPKATEGGLYHSKDRGETWEKINTPAAVESVQFIKFDHSNRMYITTGYRGGGAGVWYTDDYGKKWKQVFKYAPTECIDICPYDRNLMIVSVKFLATNPGLYLSRDRGETWCKCNNNIIIPHQVEDVNFDLFNPAEMWLATKGTGFYKGKIEGGESVQVVDIKERSAELAKGGKVKLNASIVNPKYAKSKIEWKSANTDIATVNKTTGEVTAVSNGHTKIWATTADGRFSDFTALTVQR
ncbi:MAG: Ig-like domain-containing protein [Rikenellaceae bacterium]